VSGASASGGPVWKSFGSPSVHSSVTPFVNGNGIGSLPVAPSSEAGLEGGAYLSDGFTPAPGGLEAGFMKGNEMYNGSTTTTVVDFSLPPGVTIDTSCTGLPGNLCIGGWTDCSFDPSNFITVSGSEVEFRIACAPGDELLWEADLVSLISTPGLYDTSVQFKVGAMRRAKDATNMWQIPLPGTFCVDC